MLLTAQDTTKNSLLRDKFQKNHTTKHNTLSIKYLQQNNKTSCKTEN